jgi:hypothetical protein
LSTEQRKEIILIIALSEYNTFYFFLLNSLVARLIHFKCGKMRNSEFKPRLFRLYTTTELQLQDMSTNFIITMKNV